MGKFAEEHASALADVGDAGASVTFTLEVTQYNESTGRLSRSSPTVVPGVAMRVEGDPDLFAESGLRITDAVQLMFVASTYGDVPPMGATCTWEGRVHTVKNRRPFAPDGVAIYTDVLVAS